MLTTSFLIAVLLSVPTDLSVLSIPTAEAAPDYSTTTLRAFAVTTAKQHHLSVARFVGTLECESDWIYDATSTTGDYGVAQWNLSAHSKSEEPFYITKDEALDPYFSIQLAAAAWSAGEAPWWVCYRKKYMGGLRE